MEVHAISICVNSVLLPGCAHIIYRDNDRYSLHYTTQNTSFGLFISDCQRKSLRRILISKQHILAQHLHKEERQVCFLFGYLILICCRFLHTACIDCIFIDIIIIIAYV